MTIERPGRIVAIGLSDKPDRCVVGVLAGCHVLGRTARRVHRLADEVRR